MDVLNLVEQGKIKRIFRARRKFSYPDACCHITQRAPGRELLFLEDPDYHLMLHLMKEKSKKFIFEVYSFCLMPNHLHIQIRLQKDNLSKAMKSLFEDYARAFNRKYERKGHVFCGPYRQAICLNDAYALATSIYIHLNPVRAGLVKQAREYRWSSARLYLEPIKKKSFINYEYILGTLNQDIQQAREIYQDISTQAIGIKTDEIWEKSNTLDLFKTKLFRLVLCIDKFKNSSFMEKREVLEEETLEKQIEELSKKSRLKNPQDVKARKYLIEQLKSRGFNITQIAEKLTVSRQSVYNTFNLTKRALLKV